MKRYQAGDQVWWANCGIREVRIDCPVCFGKRTVTLILGNSDQCELPCEYCGHGFEGPRGYIMEYKYVADVELVTINEVRTHSSLGDPDVMEYLSGTSERGCHYLDPEDIFDTKEEAIARSFIKSEEATLREYGTAEHLKSNAKKSFAWNAGYHIRAAKECREDALRHEMKASICKSRSKSEPKP